MSYYDDLFDGHTTQQSIAIRGVPNGTRLIVTSDQQIPFQDDALLDVIYGQFSKDFKPRDPKAEYHNFFNGDFMDNFGLSRWPAQVRIKFAVEDEVSMAHDRLDRWRKRFTHSHFVYGNHEARWAKNIMENNPKLAAFTKPLDEVLDLKGMDYDWVPYLKHFDFEGFIVTHGDITTKHAAAAMLAQYHRPGTSGHVNRPQDFTFAAAADGDPITWYCTGMTCRVDIGDVIKDWSRIMPWQQCFGIGEVVEGVLYFQLVRVHHGGFWANGKWYKVS